MICKNNRRNISTVKCIINQQEEIIKKIKMHKLFAILTEIILLLACLF